MPMITISYLNKAEKEKWLPQLFDLFWDNMRLIAPGEGSYAEEKQQWLANVSPALEKAPRQILLCLDGEELLGYLQYYTRQDLLVLEEVQLRRDYQRTLLFHRLCRSLIRILPGKIRYVEAYADRRNLYSRKIMEKLGMEPLPEGEASPFVHLRGTAEQIGFFFSQRCIL